MGKREGEFVRGRPSGLACEPLLTGVKVFTFPAQVQPAGNLDSTVGALLQLS